MGTDQGAQLPAELRGTPIVEPTVEVDEGVRLPPEAAVTALPRHEQSAAVGDRPAPATTDDGGQAAASYRSLAAMEAEAGEAHLPPAELRVAPFVEPTVEVAEGAHLPPEAAVIPVTHHEG
jgi:hypothetical protein